MPTLKDIEQSVRLEDGGVFVGLYDPTKDVNVKDTETGTRYTFRMVNAQGRVVSLTGGARLYDRIIGIFGTSDKPRFLEIRAIGRAGSMDRNYDVKEVSGFPK